LVNDDDDDDEYLLYLGDLFMYGMLLKLFLFSVAWETGCFSAL